MQILDTLESFHGPQVVQWPTDPYEFLLWWHCGYPASEERCSRGWTSLNAQIGSSPDKLLHAPSSTLTRALKPGGMIPELRAGRLKAIAERVQRQFNGDLGSALRRQPLPEVRALLKKFPGIADPGADRIILFGGIAPVAAVPSSCPQVLVRIEVGQPPATYSGSYRQAQQIIDRHVPGTFAARTRAFLLLRQHGQQVCKRSNPQCTRCPVVGSCHFALGHPGKKAGRQTS